MEKSAAEKFYDKHEFDFELHNPNNSTCGYVFCSTRVAIELQTALVAIGADVEVIAVHPEFAGWTVEEIANNLEDE